MAGALSPARGSNLPVITLTVDLEDPTENYEADGRFVAMTRRILEMCAETKTRATFFTVGMLADAAPDLIKDIGAQGHEVAYHSHAHVPLTQENPKRFRAEAAEDKAKLEQLIGKSVIGFRAPCFSLTPKTTGALDVLKEIGFLYSSSLMPTRISRYGFAKAKRTPFKWPNGMIELPLPVGDIMGQRMPYLGGIYLYALPFWLTKSWIKRANPAEILWTYTHPYDFDRGEEFDPMLHSSLGVNAILWAARFVAEKKIRKVIALGAAPPLGERLGLLQPPAV